MAWNLNIFTTPSERELKARQREAAAEQSYAAADRAAARGNRSRSNRLTIRGIEQANAAHAARQPWHQRDLFDF